MVPCPPVILPYNEDIGKILEKGLLFRLPGSPFQWLESRLDPVSRREISRPLTTWRTFLLHLSNINLEGLLDKNGYRRKKKKVLIYSLGRIKVQSENKQWKVDPPCSVPPGGIHPDEITLPPPGGIHPDEIPLPPPGGIHPGEIPLPSKRRSGKDLQRHVTILLPSCTTSNGPRYVLLSFGDFVLV